MRQLPIAKEGLRLVIPSFVLSVLLFQFQYPLTFLAAPVFLFFLFCLYFFRNPERESDADPRLLLSPADGKILGIEDMTEHEFMGGEVRRVSIFMSPADVHVNRAPFGGRVLRVEHRAGEFALAFKKDIDKENERNYILFQSDREKVLIVQIAGFIARRIVSYVKEGDMVKRGERVGMIAFGSRVDTYISRDHDIMVSLGDKVKAGITPLARRKG